MKEQVINKTRNYGLDVLRILSMFMVVFLHVLGKGGILSATPKLSLNYEILWFFEILCYPAVNCFLMISGYGLYKSKYKFSSIISLWFQVFFYTTLITAVIAFFKPEFITENIIKYALFPTFTRHYWYFTGYFALFILAPFINTAVEHLSKRQNEILLFIIFLVFSLMPCIFNKDVFQLDDGYSLIWMIFVYICGAYIKKYGIPKGITAPKAFLGFFVCSVLSFLSKLAADNNIKILKDISLVEYTSPTMLLAAVFLLTGFMQIKTGDRANKVIAFLSPLSFGVYLIHTQKLIWNKYLQNSLVSYGSFGTFKLIAFTILTVIAIFIACLIIDYIRLNIFKLLRINKISVKLGEKLDSFTKKEDSVD